MQLENVSNHIRDNAKEFDVVVLTAIDSLKTVLQPSIQDDIEYLEEYLNATQDRCADFAFWGGLFACLIAFAHF